MYAMIGDTVKVTGQVCVIITYDDDVLQYLVWVPDTKSYLMVHQRFVTEVDRWTQAQYEEVELDEEIAMADPVAVGNGRSGGRNSGTIQQSNGVRNSAARTV